MSPQSCAENHAFYVQAQPSGRLSDSDVFAITHAESAKEAGLSANNASQTSYQRQTDAQQPTLLQLQDLANADAITPQRKSSGPAARAPGTSPYGVVAVCPGCTGAAVQSPKDQQLPALSQLRALAGVADSPQMPPQNSKSANELAELANVPLSQWQFGNTGTAHAVWQADTSLMGQPSTGLSSFSGNSPAKAQPSPTFTHVQSAEARAISPTWGPSNPPQPVHLKITVFGDADGSDRSGASPAGSKAASVRSSLGEQSLSRDKAFISSSVGFEAGYGAHPDADNAGHQSNVTAAAAEAHNGESDKALMFKADRALADGIGSGSNSKHGLAPTQLSASTVSLPASAADPGLSLANTGTDALQTNSGIDVNAQGLCPVGSAGADELAEAAAKMAGSPWDPRQGPKLLASLSDFSSFNSSLSMLQQLAGKSAAGLATLGIGGSSETSPLRLLEKKKSDKGHLISSAPTPWWRRRPGSAKKKSHAPQVGSGAVI